MSPLWNTAVYDNQAIVLGSGVCCDGFHRRSRTRVQTHVHSDHMLGFATSKGHGDIICLPGTYDLLIAKNDSVTGPDLPFRSNFKAVESGSYIEVEDAKIQLTRSDHMLGSAQVLVEHSDGYRTGYSGDFGWPTQPMEVDELVLDGTSSPATVRNYSREEAEASLLELAHEKVVIGPVLIWADIESIYRGLALLGSENRWPILIDERAAAYAEVYARHGLPIPPHVVAGTAEGLEIQNEGRYFHFKIKSSHSEEELTHSTKINLIPFRGSRDEPVFEYYENYFEVGISNHADFEQTVEYVSGTGAQRVLVDNTRSPGRAMEVAHALQERLGIIASYETLREDS